MRAWTVFAMSTLLFTALPARAADMAIEWDKLADPRMVNRYLEHFRALVTANPKNAEARIRVSEFTFYQWRLERDRNRRLSIVKNGLQFARETTELFPNLGAAWYWRGSMMAMLGLTQGILNSLQLVPEVKSSLDKAIQLDPNYRDGLAQANLGRVYTVLPGFPVSIGDRARGKELLLDGIKKYPDSSYYPLYLADAEWAEGNLEAALKYAKEAQTKRLRNDYTAFVNVINARKAKELEIRIRAGQARERFNDVLSDHEAAGVVD